VIIGNHTNGGPQVYDVTSYLDDHPGGAEVLLDCAGTDADDLFEDIGHSKDARAQLAKFKIGELYVSEEEKAAKAAELARQKEMKGKAGGGLVIAAIVVIIAAVAYKFMM